MKKIHSNTFHLTSLRTALTRRAALTCRAAFTRCTTLSRRAVLTRFTALTLCAALTACTHPQPPRNLLVNGDAEESKFGTLPAGWLNIQGHWVTEEADSLSHECGLAQSGKALFFAGNDTLGILRQEVNLREFASAIAKGKQQFSFNGYAESLDQGPTSDQARIVLSSLDSSKQNPKVLFDSDTTRSLNKWLFLQDTFLVPPSTAFIRVDLIAIRHVGGDNDGYFDNIRLMALPRSPGIWIWVIGIVAAIGIFIGIYKTLKRKRPLTSPVSNNPLTSPTP